MQPKVRGLLELLLQAQGAVVSKPSIASALWPGEAIADDSISRAVHHLRRALEGEDVHVRTLYGLGVRLEAAIEPPPAMRARAQAEIDRVVHLIASARSSPGLERAKEALRNALRAFPENATGWALLADISQSQAMRGLLAPSVAAAEIAEFCARALAHSPRHAFALSVSGWSLALLAGTPGEGAKRIDEALAAGDDWNPFYYRAWLDVAARDLAAARERVAHGLRLSPLERSLLSFQAWLALYSGWTSEADTLAREALRLHPEADTLHGLRSVIAGLRGDGPAATAHARTAAEQGGRSPLSLSFLSWALAQAGQRAEARALLEEASAHGRKLSFLAPALTALGEPTAAKTMLREAKAQGCPWFAFAWCDPRLR